MQRSVKKAIANLLVKEVSVVVLRAAAGNNSRAVCCGVSDGLFSVFSNMPSCDGLCRCTRKLTVRSLSALTLPEVSKLRIRPLFLFLKSLWNLFTYPVPLLQPLYSVCQSIIGMEGVIPLTSIAQ